MGSNQFLLISHIMSAAARLPEFVTTFEGQLAIWRKNPDPYETIETLQVQQSDSVDNVFLQAVYIPCSKDNHVQPVNMNISSSGYYLDVIARNLGLADSNNIMISRYAYHVIIIRKCLRILKFNFLLYI